MNISHTTLAGILLVASFLSVSILVYVGKTTFADASPVLLGLYSLVGGWGLFKAKDNQNNTPE